MQILITTGQVDEVEARVAELVDAYTKHKSGKLTKKAAREANKTFNEKVLPFMDSIADDGRFNNTGVKAAGEIW